MFRDNRPPFKSTYTVNCLLTDNGMGDLLCSLPAINHILTKSPWINLLIWVPNYMKEFAKHVLPSKAIIRDYTEGQKKYNPNNLAISTKLIGMHTPMRTHPVFYAFHVLCDYHPTIEESSYLKLDVSKIDLSKFSLPSKYVVMQGAYVEKVKTMPPNTFNQLIDYIKQKGYEVVFLGKTENATGAKNVVIRAQIKEEYNLGLGINLINKTSLIESAAIIEGARAFVGMDGGLMHLAGFTPTPIVCGVTFVNPLQIAPIRDGILGKSFHYITPDKELECSGCQSNVTLAYDIDFRDCFYDDFKCVDHMTFKKFKTKLDGIL